MDNLILSTNIRQTDTQWFRPTSIDNIVETFNNAIAEYGPCNCVIDGNTASMDSIMLSMLTFHEVTHHTKIIKLYGDPPGEVTFNTYSFDGRSASGATALITNLQALKPFLTELFKKWSNHPDGNISIYRDLIESERQMIDKLIISILPL